MFKALIVDDEPQIRKGLRTIISWEQYGFTVVGEASDGMDALQAAREQQPDLVITDVRMPRMDGMELSRELRSVRPDTQVLVLSGYNEFAYAKEALRHGVADYLLKPVDPAELGRSLERMYDRLWGRLQQAMKEKEKAGALRQFFLNKLMRGEVYGDPVEAARKYGVRLQADRFAVMVVSIDRYGEFLVSLPGEEIGWKRYAIGNVIQELLPPNSYMFDLSEQRFGVLLTGTEESVRQYGRATAERIAASTIQYVKEEVTVGLGETVQQPAMLRHGCQTALTALEHKFLVDTERVFVYDAQERSRPFEEIPWDDTGLLQAIRDGAEARLLQETGRLLAPLEGRYAARDTVKYAVLSTIMRLAKMTEEFHGEWQALYTGKFRELERILEQGVMKQLNAFLYELGLEICRHIDTVRNRKTDSRVRDMIGYIEQHYASELNLKELSKLFYINTVYLGQLFKKETGEYFNDYINKVRIGHASRLLAETSWPAAEIAEKVGYKYVDHFYRQFKLTFGMNPGEYRRTLPGRGAQSL
ncbi:response regulator [Paenibacillus sp. HJGM_3]|uniref:response regulator transcription factor n=1 Tax=Paenibacillus sp. HJGM_3 TaxID=3379816 RepID=UPI003858A8A9